MSSKAKKGKKKTKSYSDVTKSKETLTNKKIYAYFTTKDIAEIKTITNLKDVTGVPYVIGAALLNKSDILEKLLKDGYNINQTGQNNMTALMLAVKHKYSDLVDYLLNHGADPTIKTDSGDNVLILALEHKLWDQQSMINLWKAVKRVSFIDVNFTNKNGHTLLHMCVRRDWEDLLKLLLTEKPNIDAGNSNGVTPLMLACFRNNLTIIDILIKAGADILKEDNHGRMTLCYAISASMKGCKPQFLTANRIITEMRKKSSVRTYLKKRVELIIATAKKSEISSATSEMLIKIIQFAVQFMEEGICIFLECEVFAQILDIMTTRFDDATIVKFLLEICEEILSYNEQSVGFKVELYNKLLETFLESGLVEVVLETAKTTTDEAKTASDVLVLSFSNDERWEKILRDNNELFLPIVSENPINGLDENRTKILKTKKRKMKKILDSFDIIQPLDLEDYDKNSEEKKKTETVINSKKSRRRSKAIKAKLNKIKTVELTKRLNLTGKKPNQKPPTKPKIDEEVIFLTKPEGLDQVENPIVASFQYLLQSAVESERSQDQESYPKWRKHILRLSRLILPKNFSIDHDKLSYAINHLQKSVGVSKLDPTMNRSLNIVIDYLKQMVQMVLQKYRDHWENDRISGHCSCLDIQEHVPWLYTRHLKTLEAKEKQTVQEVQKKFDLLIKSVKELAHKDLNQCLKVLNQIESMILTHEIRGIKVLDFVSGMENFTMKYTTNANLETKKVIEHVQNVLNDIEEPRNDVEIEIIDEVDDVSFIESYKTEIPVDLYYREMSQIGQPRPRNKRKEIESKLNTIANGFHLINSIMSVCDDVDDRQKIYGIADLNYPLKVKYPKTPHYAEMSEYMPKRLKSQISSLQNAATYQKLLSSQIRICTKEQRVNYIISTGINFSGVELGLDINNQPLAVKKIPRQSWIAKIVKTLVDPLLGLMDNHILHYFACEYENNDLILATPLCKWSLTQYVQILAQTNQTAMPGLTAAQIVKQFLHGLMVLHNKCDIPIVHGNLKPSNIFIDFNGLVKIGEFGIHKALYKVIEAPKTCLIWFSKETLEIYKNSSIVECSVKSDIQVAGMLIYFVLTYGKHPFGGGIDEILKNIQAGTPKIDGKSVNLRDLLQWMLQSDATKRPNVDQVLAHPFFWTPSKKWSFVLACSGINQSGYLLPVNVEKLYRSIDIFSDPHIVIDWHEMIRNKFPTVRISENNNITGLLKFIKSWHEHQFDNSLTDSDLSCAILTLFPTLPVALYRTLQNTNWLKHAVFMPFVAVF